METIQCAAKEGNKTWLDEAELLVGDSYEAMMDLKAGITRYFEFYCTTRFYQSQGYLNPEVMYDFSSR
jgi:hypothetical protein